MEGIELLKKAFIRIVSAVSDPNWKTVSVIAQFPPTPNRGYQTIPIFKDKEENRVRVFPQPDDQFNKAIYDFITEHNKHGKVNELSFFTTRDEYQNAAFQVRFNQEIHD